jgi:hypothetical protein
MIDRVGSYRQNKERLARRLRTLWTWELFDSFFLPVIVILCAKALQRRVGPFVIYSAGLVTWLLWQGAAYWWLKLQALQADSEIEARRLRWFSVLKRVNWVLIGTGPILLLAKALTEGSLRFGFDLVVGVGFYALAVLEQLNYYHYQLMYDYPPDWRYLFEQKKLKRSSLRRALERTEGPVQASGSDSFRASSEQEKGD